MATKSAQLGTQSGYLKHVVVDAVVEVVSVLWVLDVVEEVTDVVEVVPVEVRVVGLVVVPEVSVVEVFDVVVLVVADEEAVVDVSEELVADELLVSVCVVQKPHSSSHIPANCPPQSGQKMVMHWSVWQSPVAHAWLQKLSVMMLTDTHSENVVSVRVVVVVADVAVVVVVEPVVTLNVVALVVLTLVVVPVPVLSVEVREVVMLKAQNPQEVSQMCAWEHVGQYTSSHAPAVEIMIGQVAKQSAYMKHRVSVVCVVSVVPLMVVTEVLVSVVVVSDMVVPVSVVVVTQTGVSRGSSKQKCNSPGTWKSVSQMPVEASATRASSVASSGTRATGNLGSSIAGARVRRAAPPRGDGGRREMPGHSPTSTP
jgi:hypothetical protein